jgi:hypothetical protein
VIAPPDLSQLSHADKDGLILALIAQLAAAQQTMLTQHARNAARRHHIPKQKRQVLNWAQYDAGLRQRGSLTVGFSDEAIAAWQAAPRTTRGGQAWYSPLATLTALTLRAVFQLALRQTEGLIGSIIVSSASPWRFPTTPRSAGGLRRSTCRDRAPMSTLISPSTCWWTALD